MTRLKAVGSKERESSRPSAAARFTAVQGADGDAEAPAFHVKR